MWLGDVEWYDLVEAESWQCPYGFARSVNADRGKEVLSVAWIEALKFLQLVGALGRPLVD